jgi:hypothetical protein
MKIIASMVLTASLVAGCQGVSSYSAPAGGTAHGSLPKSPVGSTFQNHFVDNWGQDVTETYQVQADHSVKLINRNSYMRD